jgi:hypothetical protein
VIRLSENFEPVNLVEAHDAIERPKAEDDRFAFRPTIRWSTPSEKADSEVIVGEALREAIAAEGRFKIRPTPDLSVSPDTFRTVTKDERRTAAGRVGRPTEPDAPPSEPPFPKHHGEVMSFATRAST